MTDWQKLQAYLKKGQEIVLLVHEKPDGDCLGSALGMGIFLQEQGYLPVLYLPNPLPGLYRFLPGQEIIRVTRQPVPENAVVIAIDCGDVQRWEYDIPHGNTLLNIDHHASNTRFGALNLVDTSAAATGEILYKLMKEARWAITPGAATCLYVAISTDTGSFRYSNVTPATFRIAGDLVDAGADLDLVRNELYENRPLEELLIMQKALETLTFTADGEIALARLPYETLKEKDLLDTDTDGIIGIMRGTEGVELALLFKEQEPGRVKVSLRSKSRVDVNRLALKFEGGGHPRAAGCTILGLFDRVVERVTAEGCRSVEEASRNERGF